VKNERGRNCTDLLPAELETILERTEIEPTSANQLRAMLRACRGGVPRCHLVSYREDGALLQELFTAQGHGTELSESRANMVRRARIEDVAGIVEVIRPLEDAGVLVRRDRDRLELEVANFFVAELDGIVVGCCALYPFQDSAELACVAVHDAYRGSGIRPGIGERLLAAAEEAAAAAGLRRLFILTTQSRDWFLEHGFEDAEISELPTPKKALYNYQRNSKIMFKQLGSSDDR
jgi:amino-acid N-acetyltransferase